MHVIQKFIQIQVIISEIKEENWEPLLLTWMRGPDLRRWKMLKPKASNNEDSRNKVERALLFFVFLSFLAGSPHLGLVIVGLVTIVIVKILG